MHLTQLERQHVDLGDQRLLSLLVGYVNSLKHSWTLLGATIKTSLHRMQIFSDRKSQVNWPTTARYPKLSLSQRFVLQACAPGRYVLQLAGEHRDMSAELKRKLCHVTAIDSTVESKIPALTSAPHLPANVAWFDQILLLDLIEHLNDPESYLDALRKKMARNGSEIIITAANAAFIMTRIRSELSPRKTSSKGALVLSHRRTFTFKSLSAMLERTGYEIVDARGVPAPPPRGFGENHWSRALLILNQLLLSVSKRLFASQICIRARPIPDACHGLKQTNSGIADLRSETLSRVA